MYEVSDVVKVYVFSKVSVVPITLVILYFFNVRLVIVPQPSSIVQDTLNSSPGTGLVLSTVRDEIDGALT